MKKNKKHHPQKSAVPKASAEKDKTAAKHQEPTAPTAPIQTVSHAMDEWDDEFPGHESPYSEIHEKAAGIPGDIAEDICEAIDEAHERGEKRSKKSKHSRGPLSFREIIIAIGFGIVLYWALNHARGIVRFIGSVTDVFSPIIIGGCIAFLLNLVLIPAERLWQRLFCKVRFAPAAKQLSKAKRPVCLALSALILAGLICGLFFIVIPELGVTFRMFADLIPNLLNKVQEWYGRISDYLAQSGITLPNLIPDADTAIQFVSNLFTEKGQQMIDKTVGVTTSIFSVLFDIVLSVVFAFYVLAQKEKLSKKSKSILYAVAGREKADAVIKIATLSNSAFTRFVTGQFTEAIIIGVLCWLGMMIFGMPYATVISAVIGATALIPVFGAFTGAAIGAILIVGVDLMQTVWFIVFIIVLQQIENNFIYPRVVGKSIGLPGILVLSSVTIGGAVFGFAGVVLGIPICSVVYCIFNEVVRKRTTENGLASEEASE